MTDGKQRINRKSFSQTLPHYFAKQKGKILCRLSSASKARSITAHALAQVQVLSRDSLRTRQLWAHGKGSASVFDMVCACVKTIAPGGAGLEEGPLICISGGKGACEHASFAPFATAIRRRWPSAVSREARLQVRPACGDFPKRSHGSHSRNYYGTPQ